MILSDDVIKILATRIDEMGVSNHTRNAMFRDRFFYAADVAAMNRNQLARIPQFGVMAIQEVETFFQRHGLQPGFLEDGAPFDLPEGFFEAMHKRIKRSRQDVDPLIVAGDAQVLKVLKSRYSQEAHDKRLAEQAYDPARAAFLRRTEILSNWLMHNLPPSIAEKGLAPEFLNAVVTDEKVVGEIEGVLVRAVDEKLNREGGPA